MNQLPDPSQEKPAFRDGWGTELVLISSDGTPIDEDRMLEVFDALARDTADFA
ncbi:MAG: hypothetical protein KDD70_12870 [Bdellovibrionales bacterium]|nr:hypothetical protein [Bdellovibrionales bacterium]